MLDFMTADTVRALCAEQVELPSDIEQTNAVDSGYRLPASSLCYALAVASKAAFQLEHFQLDGAQTDPSKQMGGAL